MSASARKDAEFPVGRCPAGPEGDARRDICTAEDVDSMVDHFYARVLADPMLAPLFIEVAGIDLSVHLPLIKRYWRKLMFAEAGYDRHTMAIHRRLHQRRQLEASMFQRWLFLFEASLDCHFVGPGAERARHLARRIAQNMARSLEVPSRA